MDAIERLLAIEEIKQVKARYFRFLDTKQWDRLGEQFAEDAIFDARQAMSNATTNADDALRVSESWYSEGRAAIIAFISTRTGPASTVHHGHMHEIEILSPTEARGIIAMEDQNLYFDPDGRLNSRLHGWGHYHEDYSKADGVWRIQRSTLSRIRVDVENFERAAP